MRTLKIRQDDSCWHTWFAWYPVTIASEFFQGKWFIRRAWWENVERRRIYSYGGAEWEYRYGQNRVPRLSY